MQNCTERKQFAGLSSFEMGQCAHCFSSQFQDCIKRPTRKVVTPVSAVNTVPVEPPLRVINTRFLHSICKGVTCQVERLYTSNISYHIFSHPHSDFHLQLICKHERNLWYLGWGSTRFKSSSLQGGVRCCPDVQRPPDRPVGRKGTKLGTLILWELTCVPHSRSLLDCA